MEAVFLDRDGVINENRRDHVKDWSEFRFLPGAIEAIARLSRAGLRVFIVTNQAIIGRGVVSRETVDAINRRMVLAIQARGGRIEAIAYCPHRPEAQCPCRKPRPGLLFELASRYRVSLADSLIIGDALTDLEAGRAAGCETILVLTGRGEEQVALARADGQVVPGVAADLRAAVELVLGRTGEPGPRTTSSSIDRSDGTLRNGDPKIAIETEPARDQVYAAARGRSG